MRDRVSIAAVAGLVAIAIFLTWRTPDRAARGPVAPQPAPAAHETPKALREPERAPSLTPERKLHMTLQTQSVVADWIGAAVVTCRVPDVPEPNHAVIRYDADALPGGFLQRSAPDRSGDVFSFYVPPGPGHARPMVEAVGTWDVSWPDVVAGEVEPCSAITSRAETSTIQGTVHARGACKDLVVSGCGTESDVDHDGSFVLLDVEPGACALRVANGHDWSFGAPPCSAPVPVEVAVGKSVAVDLSIDCDASLAACPNTWNFCGSATDMMEMAAMIKAQLATAGHPDLAQITAHLPPILRVTRELCVGAGPAIDRIATDLGLDLNATESPSP